MLLTPKTKNGIIGIDIEGVRGEYTEPNTGFELMDVEPMSVDPEVLEWKPMRGTLTPKKYLISTIKASIPIKLAFPLSFETAEEGNEWLAAMGTVFKMAGLKISQETGYVKVVCNDLAKTTGSIFANFEGVEQRMCGATMDLKLTYATKEIAVFEGTATGNFVKEFENTATTLDVISINPAVCKDIFSVKLEGSNIYGDDTKGACCGKLDISLGNDVQDYDCMQAENGTKFTEIVNREVKSTMQIGLWSGDVDDLDSDFRNSVAQVLTFRPVQADTEFPVEVIVRGDMTNKGLADNNGFLYHDIELSGSNNIAENEFEMRFYGLTADLTPPIFFPAANYEPTDGGSGTSPITVRGYIPMGSAGAIVFETADNYDSITINGELADTVTDKGGGRYDYEHSLEAEPGEKEINIVATDKAGNTAVKTINYTVTS